MGVVRATAENFKDVAETAPFTCECADLCCIQMIDLSLSEYETIHKEPNRFFVLPDHVYPEFEPVVSENERHVLVAKHDEGGELARSLTPGRDNAGTFPGPRAAGQRHVIWG